MERVTDLVERAPCIRARAGSRRVRDSGVRMQVFLRHRSARAAPTGNGPPTRPTRVRLVAESTFTRDQAEQLMPEVRRRADEIVATRADLAELGLDLRAGQESSLGGVPEAKALEARIDEHIEWFNEQGIEVKGVAPLLIDFPAELDGTSVRLCWLEGEQELAWYHRSELGFLGRRRL